MTVNTQGTSGDRVTEVLPDRRYELIDKDGVPCMVFDSAQEAAAFAQQAWPDQEQDEGRTGRGWDIQIVGVE